MGILDDLQLGKGNQAMRLEARWAVGKFGVVCHVGVDDRSAKSMGRGGEGIRVP